MGEHILGKWLEKARFIYGALEDEESKVIFVKRLLYELTGDMEHIEYIVRKFVPEFRASGMYRAESYRKYVEMIQKRAAGRRIIIYGAGFNGRCLLEGLGEETVAAFCDKKAEVGEYQYCGIRVIAPSELQEKYLDCLIVVSAYTYGNEIVDLLKHMGIKDRDILFEPSAAWGKFYSIRQYFDPDIIKLEGREIFVDGGCYDGNTVREFQRLAGNTETITLAFEPDVSNYLVCKSMIEAEKLHDVRLCQSGLWSRRTSLSFAGDTQQGAHVADDGGNMVIQCVALDEAAEELGVSPTFVKLDIEGAELEALKGMEGILKDKKPKLAICVYHKPEDIVVIPDYIKKVRPDYKLYIRHYSNWIVETVLYAI